MKNQYSSLDRMADDTGMPDPGDSLFEYVSYLEEKKLFQGTDDENVFFFTDNSKVRFVVYLQGDSFPEFHYCYETEFTKQVMIYDFYQNHDGIDFGAVLVESPEGSYGLCADLDFYKLLDFPELPVIAEVKIYALALDVMFYKDISEYNEDMKKHPVGISPSGKPMYIGTKFLSASGLIPESKAPFPSIAFLTAEILEAESRTNEITKKEFYVLKCDGTIGEFEILCSPEFAYENMQIGGVIKGRVIFRMEFVKFI